MALEPTEAPLHIPESVGISGEVDCDYFDVSLLEGSQPRYRLQPHADGGKPIGPALILESEGARALVQHLEKLLRDPSSA